VSQIAHLGTAKFGAEEFRFILDTHSLAGTYKPVLRIYRKGKNGSAAGVGPKAFPEFITRLFPKSRVGWSNSIEFALPNITWHTAYKYRQIPGFYHLHNLSYDFYVKLASKLAR
jgi:hypothetical protein